MLLLLGADVALYEKTSCRVEENLFTLG